MMDENLIYKYFFIYVEKNFKQKSRELYVRRNVKIMRKSLLKPIWEGFWVY